MFDDAAKAKVSTFRLSPEAEKNLEFIRKNGPEPGWFARGGRTRTYAVETALKHYAAALKEKPAG